MFSRCCTRRQKVVTLKNGSTVYGKDPLGSLKRSMNLIQEITPNDNSWSVQLSENVINSNVRANNPEEALRLAQWYAYLDYKELSTNNNNHESQEI
jgi:hypothetical protein